MKPSALRPVTTNHADLPIDSRPDRFHIDQSMDNRWRWFNRKLTPIEAIIS
jgi:hypothetical protein